jgi:hypothetical protein
MDYPADDQPKQKTDDPHAAPSLDSPLEMLGVRMQLACPIDPPGGLYHSLVKKSGSDFGQADIPCPGVQLDNDADRALLERILAGEAPPPGTALLSAPADLAAQLDT